ncbi:Uncharacterised protein [Chlamydia trachomatis]|nr:Uncharacterised protein [Chlamydia trachomatis]
MSPEVTDQAPWITTEQGISPLHIGSLGCLSLSFDHSQVSHYRSVEQELPCLVSGA